MSTEFTLREEPLGNRDSARFLCEASALAYLPEAAGQTAFRDTLGLEARLFSVDNTQAWLGVDEANVVVAFRGTESATTLDGLKDILLTDAMNLLVVPEGRLRHDLSAAGVGARFHKGFVDAIAEIWEPLVAAVEADLQASDRTGCVEGRGWPARRRPRERGLGPHQRGGGLPLPRSLPRPAAGLTRACGWLDAAMFGSAPTNPAVNHRLPLRFRFIQSIQTAV
ncbi:MAG: hypothetical protein ACKO4T_08375 [Planctomycetaceae bacterium]